MAALSRFMSGVLLRQIHMSGILALTSEEDASCSAKKVGPCVAPLLLVDGTYARPSE
jgi:hypothetical protein